MEVTRKTVSEWTAQGEAALAGGDWAAAARAYETLVEMLPQVAEHRYKLARAYEQLGRIQDMSDVLSDPAVAGLPQSKRALASAYMAAKDYAAAWPLIKDLTSQFPDDEKLQKWRARCDEKLSNRKIAAAVQKGKALVSAERFEEAEQAFLDLLAEYPNAAGVHSRLAQICMVQKRWAEAIPHLRAALVAERDDAEIRKSLARAFFKNGEPADAIAALVVLDNYQNEADALFLLQRCYMEMRDWERVEEAGARLISILPSGDPLRPRALEIAQSAAVERQSAGFDALTHAGAGKEAVSGYRDLAERYPQSATAWLRLGTALANCEQDLEAIEALRRYLELRPEDMEARRTVTRLIVKTSDEQSILEYVRDAMAAGRTDVECHRWLGRYHADSGDWEASLESFERAFEMEPHNAPVRLGMARALTELGRFAEAFNQLDVLVAGDAKSVQALQIKADIFLQRGRIEDAITAYEQGLEEAPKHPLISLKLSQALLLKGDIEGFHRLNDRRRELTSFIEGERQRPFADWDGQLSIEGKLLVWAERGLSVGGNILHMSVLRLLAGLGLDIVLEVPANLAALCRRSFPNVTVTESDAELPDGISHQAPIGSLSRWFKPDLASFRSMPPYLLPDLGRAKAHRRRLQHAAGEGRLLVGVCLGAEDVGAVSIDTSQFREAVALPAVTLVNVHPGAAPQVFGSPAGERMSEGGAGDAQGLDEVLALLSAMDLVVCTDNVTAHLAGAAGLTTFVLLPAVPSAYWLAIGEHSIWYPSARLFRRSQIDPDWEPVLDQVRVAMTEHFSRHGPGSWPAAAAVQAERPTAHQERALTPDEICDAVRAFVVQGPSAPAAYRSALALIERLPPDRQSKEITLLRGDLLVRFGQWEEARAAYGSLRSAQADQADVQARILSVSLAMHDLESALHLAQELAGGDPSYRLIAANILYHLRRRDEALSELRSASLQGAQPDRLSILSGTLLLEKGKYARVEAYLRDQAAMTRQPDVHTLLARSISRQGRHQEALTVFERAVSFAEDDPNANFWRTQERIAVGEAPCVPLPPLQGDMPQAAPADVVTFFVADSGYFWQHGLVLLASLGRRSLGTKCHVHVINPDDGVAPAVAAIRDMLPDLCLTFSYEHCDFEGRSDDYVRTYYASVRFVRLAEIFARAPAIYLSVDADCIVRGDIDASGLGLADVGVRMRYDERPHATVAAGALKLRPTKAAARFIDRVAMLIQSTLETGEAVWFLDQIVLSHVLRELGDDEIPIDQLGMTYIDWFFQEDSLIWTGKGPRKLADHRYTDELSRYRYIQDDERISALMPRHGDHSLVD